MTQLTVVVPTFQRASLLDGCLAALAASESADFEVVAVDDASTDDTADVLHRWAGRLPLTALTQPVNAGPAAARNRGIAAAAGDLVLFIDDDVVVSPALLRTHVALHEEGDDSRLAVLGRVAWLPALRVTPFMRWLDGSGLQFAYDTWLREGPVDPPAAAFYTANLSVRRDLLQQVGGFDERFPHPAYEDMELAHRLSARGLRMDYRPAALAWHARPIDLATFRRRMAMVARSTAVLAQAAPDFAIDDGTLRRHDVRRRQRLRLQLRAALLRTDEARSQHYWAEVGHAYVSALHAVDD